MYKQVITLLRGSAHEAAEQFTDANALPILRQQIRDSAASIQASKASIAAAMVQYEAELDHHRALTQRIKDLEHRAIAAIEQNEDELAQEAADALETDAVNDDEHEHRYRHTHGRVDVGGRHDLLVADTWL